MFWLDAAGRFSAFKCAVFVLLVLPAAFVAWAYAAGALGAQPIEAATHEMGNWAIRLVLLSLAVTPARSLLGFPRLMQVRRMVGVAAFAYVAAHLGLYIAEEAFDLAKVAAEIVLRSYLTIGFAALLVLAAMAATSTDGMIRRLGGRRWRRLHALVYPATLLALVHFFMQTKADVTEPWIMTGLFLWLMGWRAVRWLGLGNGRLEEWWPVMLAVLAALATAAGEAVYYWILTGVEPTRLLAAHFMLLPGLRPAWYVLAICLAAALAGALSRGAMAMAPARPAARATLRGRPDGAPRSS
jgi:sulfoxide reductase heme-binding subunit YedZ